MLREILRQIIILYHHKGCKSLKVVFRKLRCIKYMGGSMLKEALFFFFFFFFVFLDCVKYNYYRQRQFLQQKYKKNKEEKEEFQQ